MGLDPGLQQLSIALGLLIIPSHKAIEITWSVATKVREYTPIHILWHIPDDFCPVEPFKRDSMKRLQVVILQTGCYGLNECLCLPRFIH